MLIHPFEDLAYVMLAIDQKTQIKMKIILLDF